MQIQRAANTEVCSAFKQLVTGDKLHADFNHRFQPQISSAQLNITTSHQRKKCQVTLVTKYSPEQSCFHFSDKQALEDT